MVGSNAMNEFTREWREMTRMENLQRTRQMLGGGGRAPASGGISSSPCDFIGRAYVILAAMVVLDVSFFGLKPHLCNVLGSLVLNITHVLGHLDCKN
jgi:hypothetical protein